LPPRYQSRKPNFHRSQNEQKSVRYILCTFASFVSLLVTFYVPMLGENLGYFCNKNHEVNNHPMGENSPNPVTLFLVWITLKIFDCRSDHLTGCRQNVWRESSTTKGPTSFLSVRTIFSTIRSKFWHFCVFFIYFGRLDVNVWSF
jgi:hypothetical protein